MFEAKCSQTVQQRAAEYLDGLPTEERRLNGQVYTPEHIVDFILDEAGYTAAHAVEAATLLDPACGAGVFLERAVGILADRLRALGADLRSSEGHRRLHETVAANLFGVDVDPQACKFTRTAVRNAILRLSPGVLPERYFTKNVLEADFLMDCAIDELSPVTAGGLAFIVGNPPYVSATRIELAYKEQLRQRFTTATGRLDLYTVFIERSVALLRQNGRVALITPDKFLVSQTGRALRAFLLRESAVSTVAQFTSHKVFAGAATVPCITVVERKGTPGDVKVLICRDEPADQGHIAIVSRSTVAQADLTSAAWHLVEPDLHDVARRLQAHHPTLASRTVRVSAGPATGRDGVYVVTPETGAGIEPELLRPAVRGRDLTAYHIDDSGLQVLVPYTFDRHGTSSIADLAAFPGARRYLARHRADLEARHCVRVWGKVWYDLHDQVLLDLARQTKILVPDVASSNRFTVDQGKYFPLHSVYYIIPKNDIDPYYLTAIMNSRMAEFLIRLLSPVVKDGFSRYRQQFLATVPVPDGRLEEVKAIIAAARAGDAARADQLVTALFHPSDADLARIDRYLAARAIASGPAALRRDRGVS